MMGLGGGGEGEMPAPPPPPSNEIVDITDKIAKPECFVLNQVGWVVVIVWYDCCFGEGKANMVRSDGFRGWLID
jgi:hypothetical protein